MQIEWTKVWAVVITGLVVVFLALVLLIIFVTLFGKIFQSSSKKSNDKKNSTPPAPQKPAPVEVNATKETVASESEDDNIIAVISAAVAMMAAKDGKNYAVKSIKRAINKSRSSRSVWGAAGQRENTRPF